jgi:Ca2+-binding RTX toxin-like protein
MATYTGTPGSDVGTLFDQNAEDQVDDDYFGLGGNDSFGIGRGSDTAYGGAGADIFVLLPETLDTPIGPTEIYGGTGEDRLQLFGIWYPTTTIRLVAGDRIVSPTLRYESIEEFSFTGGDAAETVFGSTGDDFIAGNGGTDNLQGGVGNDDLTVGAGRDTLNGGRENDLLKGAAIFEPVTKDVFVFNSALSTYRTVRNTQVLVEENVDLIQGYDSLDRIYLDNSIFKGLAAGALKADAYHRSANGQAGDAQDRIIVNTRSGEISYDRDGTGKKYDAIEFAQCVSFVSQPVVAGISDFLVI